MFTYLVLLRCTVAVSNVYGGVLTFQGLHSRGQGWSPDLLQLHTDTFKTLATKVETAVSLHYS